MTEQPARRKGRVLAAALVTSVILLLVALCVRKIWTVDYWWQWKTGEHIAEHGMMHADPFSWTHLGSERMEIRWAYCLAEFWISEWFGRGSMILVKTAIVLATFAAAAATIGRGGGLVTGATVVALAGLASYQRFYERPELFNYLCVAVFMLAIERRRHGPTRWIYVLPFVQILWTNTHGSSMLLGPILVLIWAGAEAAALVWQRTRSTVEESGESPARRLRVALVLVVALLAATLVNPYGVRSLESSVLIFAMLQSASVKEYWVELRSPFSFSQRYTALIFYEVLIGLAVLSVFANLRRQSFYWIALVGSQLVLSVSAIRNLPLFALVAIPFITRNVRESPWWAHRVPRLGYRALRPVVAIAVIAGSAVLMRELVTNRFAISQGDTNQFGLGIASHRYPIRAAEFLQSTGVRGRVLNDPGSGSLLIAHGFQVFIDPRGDVYLDQQDAEFADLTAHPEKLAQYQAKYGFELAFIATDFVPLALATINLPGWRLVYLDCEALIVFGPTVGKDTPTLDVKGGGVPWFAKIREHLPPPVAYASRGWLTTLTSPAPYRRLAAITAELGDVSATRVLLADALAAYPPGFADQDYFPLAEAYAVGGDRARAAEYFERAAELLPADANIQRRAAMALLSADAPARAITLLERALAVHPDDAPMLGLLGVTELKLNKLTAAAEHLARAATLDPRSAAYQRAHGTARARLGQWDAAIEAYETVLRLDPQDPNSTRELARAWMNRRDLKKARDWIDRALEQNPADEEARKLRAQIEAAARGS